MTKYFGYFSSFVSNQIKAQETPSQTQPLHEAGSQPFIVISRHLVCISGAAMRA